MNTEQLDLHRSNIVRRVLNCSTLLFHSNGDLALFDQAPGQNEPFAGNLTWVIRATPKEDVQAAFNRVLAAQASVLPWIAILQSALLDQRRIHDLQARVAENWPKPKQGPLQQVVSAFQFRITNTDLLLKSVKPDMSQGEAGFFAQLHVTDFGGHKAEPFDAEQYINDMHKEAQRQLDHVVAQVNATNVAAQQLLQLRLGDVMAKVGGWSLIVAIVALVVAAAAAYFAYESVQSVVSGATQTLASPSAVKASPTR
jgi:hypothetical protein